MKNSWIVAAISVCLLVGMIIGVVYLEKGQNVDIDTSLSTESTAATETTTEATTETTIEIDGKWEEILTYRAYLDMTPEERDDFYASFEDPNEFYAWFDAVKVIYDQERKDNQIEGNGSLDMGELDNAG